MINLDRYLTFSAWVGILGLCSLLIVGMRVPGILGPVFIIFLAVMGFTQIPTALRISLSDKPYPEWVREGIAFYWISILGCVIVSFALSRLFTFYELVFGVWIMVFPFAITVYQFSLLNRYNNELLASEGTMEESKIHDNSKNINE